MVTACEDIHEEKKAVTPSLTPMPPGPLRPVTRR